MGTPLRAYTGITAEKFQAMEANADKLFGLQLVGTSGTSSSHGITLAFAYDPSSQVLTFTRTKGWGMFDGMIGSHLDELQKTSGL